MVIRSHFKLNLALNLGVLFQFSSNLSRNSGIAHEDMSSVVVGTIRLRAQRKTVVDQRVAYVTSLSGLNFFAASGGAFSAAGSFASAAVGESLLLFLFGLLSPALRVAKCGLINFLNPFSNN